MEPVGRQSQAEPYRKVRRQAASADRVLPISIEQEKYPLLHPGKPREPIESFQSRIEQEKYPLLHPGKPQELIERFQ